MSERVVFEKRSGYPIVTYFEAVGRVGLDVNVVKKILAMCLRPHIANIVYVGQQI